MLLKRDNKVSDSGIWMYPVSEHKTFCFDIERDRSINRIGLIDWRKTIDITWFELKTLCYMEMLTIDDGELLDLDALIALARREDNA